MAMDSGVSAHIRAAADSARRHNDTPSQAKAFFDAIYERIQPGPADRGEVEIDKAHDSSASAEAGS